MIEEYSDCPLVSVIIPYFNNKLMVVETLKSIFNQTYPNIEIILTDDGSDEFPVESIVNWISISRTDNIKKIVISSNNVNLGTVKNFEIGLDYCEGEIITHIAADDVFFSNDVF